MNPKYKAQNGITLIALVITIIVLLILAGVVIASLTGENGLLERAASTKDKTEEGRVLDEIGLAWHEVQIDALQHGWTNEQKAAELARVLGNGATASASGDVITVNYNGYTAIINTTTGKIDINKASKVEITVGGIPIDGSNISGNEVLKADYGKITNYTSVAGITWKLFYDDATNIYLMANDFAPGDSLPSELLTDGQYTTYCRYFATGNDDTTSPIPSGDVWKEASSATTVQNNPYLKWVGSSADDKSNKNINMKAVAFMMDTNKWSNFAGSAAGATAIGGPTLEMFVLSYNAKFSGSLGTYQTIIYGDEHSYNDNVDSYGYKVKNMSGMWGNYVEFLGYSDETDNQELNVWFKCDAYSYSYGAKSTWLASPGLNGLFVSGISNYGGGISSSCLENNGAGFRPLVSIPKSSIK